MGYLILLVNYTRLEVSGFLYYQATTIYNASPPICPRLLIRFMYYKVFTKLWGLYMTVALAQSKGWVDANQH